MPRPTTIAIATLAAAVALAASGCTPEAPPAVTVTETAAEAPAPTTESPSATEAAPEPPAATEAAPAPAADGTTAPGTVLGIDDVATVNWYGYSEGEQQLDIWIDSIEPGAQSDFKKLSKDFRDQVAEYDVYYITVKSQKSGPNTLKMQYESIGIDISGIDTDGNRLQKITVIGDFKPCKLATAPPSIDKGKVATTCIIVGTQAGQEIGGAMFSKGSGVYSLYDGLGITWEN